jgi:hypothetical protein
MYIHIPSWLTIILIILFYVIIIGTVVFVSKEINRIVKKADKGI